MTDSGKTTHIVAVGGGLFCDGLADFVVRLTGRERPRLLYVGTAGALIRDGFPAGYAADAGVGLHFADGELREVVACREGTTAYRVGLEGGEVRESLLPAGVLV